MSETLHVTQPAPRPVSRRGAVLAIAIVALFAVVYVLVIRAYQVEGDLSTTDFQTTGDVDVVATVEPIDFDARTNSLTTRLRFDVINTELLDEGVRLKQGIRVTVNGADGPEEVRFAQGEPIGNTQVSLGTSGDVYAYPFDVHEGFISLAVETFERGAGGINETTGQLSSQIVLQGAVSGWDISAELRSLAGFPLATFNLNRSFSNQAFAFVLILIAVSVAVLVLIVSLMVVTNRRKFEVALLAWNGAVLFALPLLRTYLPGTPPIGAAMDVYLYLWTFVLAASSLVLMVVAWSQQRKSDLIHEALHLQGVRHGS